MRAGKRKAVLYGLFCICMICISAGISYRRAYAADTKTDVYEGDNIGDQDYTNRYWSSVVNSYLHDCGDGTLMRVQYVSSAKKIVIEYYDENYKLKDSKTLDPELPLFGGFHERDGYYYILTGQNNPTESDEVEVYRVTKYDKKWNRINSCGLYGANTAKPFEGGSARIDHPEPIFGISLEYLVIRTCHEMYQSSDGYHHQANVTMIVNTRDMTITKSCTEVSNSDYGYISHSFNQFVKFDKAGKLVAVDHGDAYPRSVVLSKYTYSLPFMIGLAGNIGDESTPIDLVKPDGGSVGNNYTGMTVGGFELSSTNYMVVGTKDITYGTKPRNIYVATLPLDATDDSKVTYKTIANVSTTADTCSTPQLVKITDDSFLVLWTQGSKLKYVKLDGSGSTVGAINSMDGALSDCQPIVSGDHIVWYTWKDGIIDFYEINTSTLDSKKSELDLTHTHNYECSEVKDGKVTLICKKCGETMTKTIPTSAPQAEFWKDKVGYYYVPPLQVGDIVNVEAKYAQDVDIYDSVVKSSNTNIVEVGTGDFHDTYYPLTIKKPGIVTLTVSHKYDSSLTGKYTLRIGSEGEIPISDCDIYLDQSSYNYTGTLIKPVVAVKYQGQSLEQNVDYRVNYENNLDIGTGIVKISGEGIFGSEIEKQFQIVSDGSGNTGGGGTTGGSGTGGNSGDSGTTGGSGTGENPGGSGNIENEEVPDVSVMYRTHVQTYGDQDYVSDGIMSGTSGEAKRLEAIYIRVNGNSNLGIQYTTHCQTYGWLPWSANGEMNGTQGEAKRLEAIKIKLTGADKDKYDVYYRVHAQSFGWLNWARNGQPSGSAGYGKRLEGIQIVVQKKGMPAPGNEKKGIDVTKYANSSESYIAVSGQQPVVGQATTSSLDPQIAGDDRINVAYRTHVQTYGWQAWKYNGVMSGTSGEAKRLEGINIRLTNQMYSGSIVYTTHVQTYGWQGNQNNPNTWKRDGEPAGTSGEAKRLEAIRIALTGEMAEHYDVYYRVHAQTYGWLGWTCNGAPSGTATLGKRLEGIQIVLVPKGQSAPARNYNGVVSAWSSAYITR